jgi:hypothetical protein
MSNDEILEFFVQKVEETSIGFSVTLTIGGLVVEGELVRSKLYYDYLSRLFETYTDKSAEGKTIEENVFIPKTKDLIELETLDKYHKDWKKFVMELRSKNDKDNSSPKYIHLYNVEIREIFSTEPFRFKYWRGKLSSIDGFSLGRSSKQTLEKDEQPPEFPSLAIAKTSVKLRHNRMIFQK